MAFRYYEARHYTGGIPCFCHFGYISAHHTPHNPNWHRDVEILACTKGEGYVECDDEKIYFSEGETVVINSGVSHRIYTDSHVEYFFLIIDYAFQEHCGFDMNSVYFQKKICDKALYDSFMKIVEITHSEDDFRVLKTRIYLSEYLLVLMEKYMTVTSHEDKSEATVHAKKALEYILYNYTKPITVTEIAEYVGVGRTRLAKEFKVYTGTTLLEQINIIRARNAKKMIKTGVKISEAAEACGFENKSYFTKIFKKYNNELPIETKANQN